LGLFIGLFIGLGIALYIGLVWGRILGLVRALEWGLVYALGYAHYGLVLGLVLGLVYALGYGLLETRSVLITSRSPEEARSRSLIAALTWLASGLASGLIVGLVWGGLYWSAELGFALVEGLGIGLFVGLVLALNNGGWFVWLQKDAHRRLARATKLPPRPYDFLAWGIEQQIFRRVGGGVRFRHNLIQQRLVNASKGTA